MPADDTVDTIIVGQGLAGTALAWHLVEAGQRILIIDPDARNSASKIAAGLITPITGQRLSRGWSDDEWSTCHAFYRRIEARTGGRFFHQRTAIRLLTGAIERKRWDARKERTDFQASLVQPQPDHLVAADVANAAFGGFAMHAAQLDTGAYLAASRAALPVLSASVDWAADVQIDDDGVRVLGRRGKRVISCEGYAATGNPYLAWLPFRAAKGEILTARLGFAMAPQTLHHGIWVAPTDAHDVVRIGATHDWDCLDDVPTAAGRRELESKLQGFFKVPYAVIAHQAAVRPILRPNQVAMGMHPRHLHVGYFNGLGSKGSLRAPWHAQAFAAFLAQGTPLPAQMTLQGMATDATAD